MSYKRRTFRFPNAIEVEEYHTARYGAPGQSRQKKQKATPEQMEKKNQRKKEDSCRRKLRNNFQVNDFYVTLTYAPEERPEDMAAAKKDFQKLIRPLRKEYASSGAKLKWIRNIEVGTRGGWHIHMVINRIPGTDILLQRLWKKGRVHYQLLHDKGEFRDLATYLTKTPKTDPRLKEASYSTSRNLPVPDPEEKIVGSRTWRKKPYIPDGWYLDKASFYEGINPVTGYPGRRYTLLRIPVDGRKTYHQRC
ncbi:MAG: hypothetical protein IKM88_02325 [Lachnospiraceae bacterium]|nr:hypothetical protein [Lachnospiraceae bacterium]